MESGRSGKKEKGRAAARWRLWLLGAVIGVTLAGEVLVGWEVFSLPTRAELRAQLLARYPRKGEGIWRPLGAISPRLQTAVRVWEDPAFYSHPGVSLAYIRQALLLDLASGSYARGGSTITQQVVKNLFLSREKTLRRKLKEALLARRLEGVLSKDQILEMYLNIADWGEGIAGAEAASRFYFHKPAGDVSWAEAALLAGILPNPHRLNPLEAPELAKQSRQSVLAKLLRYGHLKPEEFYRAVAAPLPHAEVAQFH